MKAYDYTDKSKYDRAKQRSLEAIDVRLEHHEKVTRIVLVVPA
jgi:hypothetical protein